MTRITSKSRSTALVSALCAGDPVIATHGFRKAVRLIAPEAEADFIPDAFAIRHDTSTVDIIEAVDTNPIMRHKAAKSADLAYALADSDWQLVVVGYDACGGLMFELPGEFFSSSFIGSFMGEDHGNAIPAAMCAARQRETMPLDDVARLWRSLP